MIRKLAGVPLKALCTKCVVLREEDTEDIILVILKSKAIAPPAPAVIYRTFSSRLSDTYIKPRKHPEIGLQMKLVRVKTLPHNCHLQHDQASA
jgi:hypothetical protein